jgi:hypothetical protein
MSYQSKFRARGRFHSKDKEKEGGREEIRRKQKKERMRK